MENVSNAEVQEVSKPQMETTQVFDAPADTASPAPSITQTTRFEEQEAQTSEGNEVAEPTQDVSAKEDPNRLQYWQSQADKAKNEASAMAKELELYKKAIESMNNAPVSNGTQPQPQADPLKEPTPPEKPISYSEIDAYNDPESDSFKYRMAKEKFQDERYDYLKRLEYARIQEQDQLFAQQQEKQMMNQAYSTVKNQYGWDDMKAADFIGWATNPNNVTLDVLAKLFDIQNAPTQEQINAVQKKQEFQQASQALQNPTTPSAQTGQSKPPMNEEDLFNAALLSQSKIRKQ